MKQTSHWIAFSASGFFLFLDQILKYLARMNPDFTSYIIPRWLGWEYLPNPGIAFSIPFPNWLILVLTPPILLWLGILLAKNIGQRPMVAIGLAFIIDGAISNYIDRMLFGVTIDYLRVLTGVINIADIMIAVGAAFLLRSYREASTLSPPSPTSSETKGA
ncbi:MAG: signal peptidase II [Patescibacteria group bacterium]